MPAKGVNSLFSPRLLGQFIYLLPQPRSNEVALIAHGECCAAVNVRGPCQRTISGGSSGDIGICVLEARAKTAGGNNMEGSPLWCTLDEWPWTMSALGGPRPRFSQGAFEKDMSRKICSVQIYPADFFCGYCPHRSKRTCSIRFTEKVRTRPAEKDRMGRAFP